MPFTGEERFLTRWLVVFLYPSCQPLMDKTAAFIAE